MTDLRICRYVLGLVEEGKLDIFGEPVATNAERAAVAKAGIDGLIQSGDGIHGSADDRLTLTAKGERWIATYDKHHGMAKALSPSDQILDWTKPVDNPGYTDGVEHSIIGRMIKQMDGFIVPADPIPERTDKEIAAVMIAEKKGWLECGFIGENDDRSIWEMTHEGQVWLISSLQEDTLNEILQARVDRAKARKHEANPLWGSW